MEESKFLFENWRRFMNEEFNLDDRPTSVNDPRIHYNDGSIVCYTQKDGTGYCGTIKTNKPEPETPSLRSLTQAEKDAWLAMYQPPKRREREEYGASGEEHEIPHRKKPVRLNDLLKDDICQPMPRRTHDGELEWVCTAGPKAGMPAPGMNRSKSETDEERWARLDPTGYAVHLAAVSLCGNDKNECYIDYVFTHDPSLKTSTGAKVKKKIGPVLNSLESLKTKFQK